jgi:hypothetical protein
MPDERQCGCLGAIDELVNKLDGERGGQQRRARERAPGRASIEAHGPMLRYFACRGPDA